MNELNEEKLELPNAKVTGADAAGYRLECSFKPERHRRPVDRRVRRFARPEDRNASAPECTGWTGQRAIARILGSSRKVGGGGS